MITFEDHKKFGNAIKEFRGKLIKEAIKEKSYKNTPEQKALKLLDSLKDVLDNIICRDFKEKPNKEVLSVYYGEEER